MPAPPNRVAVVFDCDYTLAEDTTSWLLTKLGMNSAEVYKEAANLIHSGWDPPLAYLNIILRESRDGGKLSNFTKFKLDELTSSCHGLFYPGTENLFERLKTAVQADQRFATIGIQANFYIITGGIEEFISRTPVGKTADAVWGSSFDYDTEGRPQAIKNAMSFTEKTRYLFCINKGVASQARSIPYIVNTDEPMRDARAVPFPNMIYVGDGPSDIPCMSVVTQYGGIAIGILHTGGERVWEVGYGRRANFTIPTDYRENEVGYRYLKSAVLEVAERIRKVWEFQIPTIPEYKT